MHGDLYIVSILLVCVYKRPVPNENVWLVAGVSGCCLANLVSITGSKQMMISNIASQT